MLLPPGSTTSRSRTIRTMRATCRSSSLFRRRGPRAGAYTSTGDDWKLPPRPRGSRWTGSAASPGPPRRSSARTHRHRLAVAPRPPLECSGISIYLNCDPFYIIQDDETDKCRELSCRTRHLLRAQRYSFGLVRGFEPRVHDAIFIIKAAPDSS